MNSNTDVRAWTEEVVIPTYLPALPDVNPMFLEKRVYQGSNGKVYPLPFTDRIAETRTDRVWKVIWLENEYLRVMVLPELGGRIHRIQDKTNGYDLIYYQPVIKPALVGLAGPWVSGGIEFNWPQHHRPATFLPVDFHIEDGAFGSKIVWCSDHDPMARMKGMHGVCLHPGLAYVELKVRAYNRTPLPQTFLWWANVATRVHEGYQSFFPPDVSCVADHARRAMSEYPLCQGFYYGVNYGERGKKGVPAEERPAQFVPPHTLRNAPASAIPRYAPNDLSWYANIPTPCSYMCLGSKEDFLGGYDHKAQAGLVHIADHHIAPGKKQWTWGNHPFGYAWDRNLTDADERGEFGPYIEVMAGVFTDNQPDFSFLQPGETRSWSQYWYPIQKIGPAQHANLEAAVSLRVEGSGAKAVAHLGVAVTQAHETALVELRAGGKVIAKFVGRLSPSEPLVRRQPLPRGAKAEELSVEVSSADGRKLISYSSRIPAKGKLPAPATEPSLPRQTASADELYLTGLHLEQYRHATRCPTDYWLEALRRDPMDSRCNNAMGLWQLRRGEFAQAESRFRNAIERLTQRNHNPRDGEPYYNLGLCLRFLNRDDEAYDALYKSIWNQAWQAAGFHALAEIDCARRNWAAALQHLDYSLCGNTANLRARNLKVVVLRMLDREEEASQILRETLALDPLDWWARMLHQENLDCDLQTGLDIAHDLARIGFEALAISLLKTVRPNDANLPTQSLGVWPLVEYTLGWLWERLGDKKLAAHHCKRGAALSPDYCFPARLEEIAVLETAMRLNPRDARAPYYLGNLLYDRRRQVEAIRLWERSAKLDPHYSVVWRNLGIGYFNIFKKPGQAKAAYDKAVAVNSKDARLIYERDQLWKRLGETPAKRLRQLEQRQDLARGRDDLCVEMCALYNQTRQPAKALQLLRSRKFQPWEGGEGQALGQHVRTYVALGRNALATGDTAAARAYFEQALTAPENLGEAFHLLSNQSDTHYWLGVALDLLGERGKAREHWQRAAGFQGDFQEMSVRAFSEMTFYSALSLERLGQKARARKIFLELLDYGRKLFRTTAKIDYFATSLPTMLLFDDDLQFRQETTALFLQAQAQLGLGQRAQAKRLLQLVLTRDPNYAAALDFSEL